LKERWAIRPAFSHDVVVEDGEQNRRPVRSRRQADPSAAGCAWRSKGSRIAHSIKKMKKALGNPHAVLA
jgi:hypothetical protein